MRTDALPSSGLDRWSWPVLPELRHQTTRRRRCSSLPRPGAVAQTKLMSSCSTRSRAGSPGLSFASRARIRTRKAVFALKARRFLRSSVSSRRGFTIRDQTISARKNRSICGRSSCHRSVVACVIQCRRIKSRFDCIRNGWDKLVRVSQVEF